MVSITELDLNMLPAPENFGGASVEQNFEYNKALNPYTNGVPKDVQRLMDERWTEFFRIYNKYRDNIVRVCLWGVGDGDSWHNDWPVKGRTAYPLLFDRRYKAKPVQNEQIQVKDQLHLRIFFLQWLQYVSYQLGYHLVIFLGIVCSGTMAAS